MLLNKIIAATSRDPDDLLNEISGREFVANLANIDWQDLVATSIKREDTDVFVAFGRLLVENLDFRNISPITYAEHVNKAKEALYYNEQGYFKNIFDHSLVYEYVVTKKKIDFNRLDALSNFFKRDFPAIHGMIMFSFQIERIESAKNTTPIKPKLELTKDADEDCKPTYWWQKD